MSRIARAVHRVSAAFRADPELELSRDDVQRLTELEPAETEVVIEALADAGVLGPDRSHIRAKEASSANRPPAPARRRTRRDE